MAEQGRPHFPEQMPAKPRRHTARNIALAGTALGALGAGAYGAYQNVPAVYQSVDTLGQGVPERWNSLFSKPTFEERFPIALPKERFTSVTSEAEKEEMIGQKNIVDFIQKPFDIKELIKRVKKIVE